MQRSSRKTQTVGWGFAMVALLIVGPLWAPRPAYADNFVNVVTFGADPTGVSDSSVACATAVSSIAATGGTIFFPRGNYRFSNGCVLKTIAFRRGVHVVGEGQQATFITADLNVPFVFQLGVPGSNGPPAVSPIACSKCSIERLSITRATGTIPAGSIGISGESVDYGTVEDVDITRQGYAVRTSYTNNLMSLGFNLNRFMSWDCNYHVYLNNITEVRIQNTAFGRNGGETIAPIAHLTLTGQTNDVRVEKTQFIPGVAATNNTTAISFYQLNSIGYFQFDDINTENVKTVFASDSLTPAVQQVYVWASRLTTTPTGTFASFHTNTQLVNWSINNNALASASPVVLRQGKWSRFVGNFVNGFFEFNGGTWIVANNTFSADSTYSGAFGSLVLSGNQGAFNGSIPIHFNITGTGKITVSGNGVDAGTPPTDRPF